MQAGSEFSGGLGTSEFRAGAYALRVFFGAMRRFGWIGEESSIHFGKRGEAVNWPASQSHNVLGVNASDQQGVCYERAVTTTWQRFGAHQCDPVLVCQPDQLIETLLKRCCLHVICITSKRSIVPPNIDGIGLGMTQPAESRYMNIFQTSLLQ